MGAQPGPVRQVEGRARTGPSWRALRRRWPTRSTSRCTITAVSAGRCSTRRPQQPAVPDALRPEVAELGRILGYHAAPHVVDPDAAARCAGQGADARRAAEHLQRVAAGRGRLHRQGHHDRVLRVRRLRPSPTWTPSPATYGLPQFTPEVVGGELDDPARRDDDGSRGGPRRRTGCAQGRVQRPIDSVGDGAFEKIGEMFAEADRRYPRRRLELLDRLGLRQADHRSRSCAGAVRTGDGAVATAPRRSTPAETSRGWNARAATTGRLRRATADIGLDSLASLPEMTDVGGTTLSTESDGQMACRAGLVRRAALGGHRWRGVERCSTGPNGSGR